MYFVGKYIDFKKNIHQLFPTIYDTKFLSFELREILTTEGNYFVFIYLFILVYRNVLNTFFFFSEKWKHNTLSGLVNYFTEEQGKRIALGSPIIKLTTDSDKLDGR